MPRIYKNYQKDSLKKKKIMKRKIDTRSFSFDFKFLEASLLRSDSDSVKFDLMTDLAYILKAKAN